MRLILIALVILLVLLQYRLWSGDGGVTDVWRLRNEVARQVQENERLRVRNRALAAEVEDLKQGVAAIEERARSELGMIREGEIFYQAVEEE